MNAGRRAYVEIEYDGKNISQAIGASVLSVTYTDNTDKADDLQITLDDRDANWRGDWYPKVAAKKEG